MKKKVPSKASLQSQALKTGATITNKRGVKFNSSKKTAVSRIPDNAKKTDIEKDQAKGLDNSRLLADTIASASESNVRMMRELKQQIAEIKLSMPAPPDSWAIDWIRDENGFASRTVLTPIYNKRIVN